MTPTFLHVFRTLICACAFQAAFAGSVQAAVEAYVRAVKVGEFPGREHTYA